MTLEEQVKDALDKIRPQLQADGGDLEFIELQDGGKVLVKLTGACGNCPMATMTLKQGVVIYVATLSIHPKQEHISQRPRTRKAKSKSFEPKIFTKMLPKFLHFVSS